VIHLRPDYADRIQDAAGLIPDDEPVFLLRGKDAAAAFAVLAYSVSAQAAGADTEFVKQVKVWSKIMQTYAERAADGPPDAPTGALRGLATDDGL
jgi:hypothetical protein